MTDDFEAPEELKSKDITLDLEIKAEPVEEGAEETEEKEERGDHPAVVLLDMAVKQSVEMCKKNRLPPPNMKFYNEFSKPFLNEAFWHYFPSGDLPDSPRVALFLGVAGLGLAYIPTIMAYYSRMKEERDKRWQPRQKEAKEAKEAKEEKERKAEEQEQEKTPAELRREMARKNLTAFG
jgi:hypothetical protein